MKKKSSWENLVFVFIALCFMFSWYFYQKQITSFWDNIVKNSKVLSVKTTNDVRDCGTGVAPKTDATSLSENDAVLACLGESAISCQNAIGVLKDDFFPTIVEIIKSSSGSCNFKLSYGIDTRLKDITGKELAGQYIMCPVGVVKAMDSTNPADVKFNMAYKANFSEYASQMYSYGTLGLFIENNLDQNKIQALGCSGEYIDSVINSYQLLHKK